ncbi:MAG: hypothetical protein AAFV53_17745 [Myxococcota bacterium]
MEIEESLKALLAGCTWVRDASTALRLVPALASDLPPLLNPDGDDDLGFILPVACADEITAGVAAVLESILPAAATGRPREPIHQASPEVLRADPLIRVLAALMADASWPTLQVKAVPAIVTAWAAARLLQGEPAPGGYPGRQLRSLVNQLHDLSSQRRGAALASVAWSLNGRLAAAGALARRVGFDARTGGLPRALLTSPLTLAFPAGLMQESADFATAAGVLGVELDAIMIEHLRVAAQAAVRDSMARVNNDNARPVDIEWQMLSRDVVGDPLFHLGAGARLIASLPQMIDTDGLVAAGLPASVAAGLGRQAAAAALGSAWGSLVEGLLRWDVLSSLCAAISPTHRDGDAWIANGRALADDVPWILLSPRAQIVEHTHTVVAVRLTDLRHQIRTAAAAQGMPLAAGFSDRIWTRLVQRSRAFAAARQGEFGVAAFEEPLGALAFARDARRSIRGLRRIDAGELWDPILLVAEPDVALGMASDTLEGGTDGVNTWLEGPAVAQAISMCGVRAGGIIPDDPLEIRHASVGPDGLQSNGIIADNQTIELLIQRIRTGRGTLHVQGSQDLAGGVRDDFQLYPMRAWWENSGGVFAVLSLTDAPGAGELLYFTPEAFAELHSTEAAMARLRDMTIQADAPEPAPPVPPTPPQRTPSRRISSPPVDDEPSFDPYEEPSDPFLRPVRELNPDIHLEPLEAPTPDPFRAPEPTPLSIGETAPPPPRTAPPLLLDEGDEDDLPSGNFALLDAPFDDDEDSDLALLPPTSSEPAFTMQIEDDDEELTGEQISPPMLSEDDPEMDETERDASPPMMLEDEEDLLVDRPTLRVSPPMILEDPDEISGFFDPPVLPVEPKPPRRPPEIRPQPPTQTLTSPQAQINVDGARIAKPPLPENDEASEDFLTTDIAKMFEGYVVVGPIDGKMTFGLLDDRSLRDAHSYPIHNDADKAYHQFLMEKRREGFVPQIHRTFSLEGQTATPLNMASLERAYRRMLSPSSARG